jgi:hypothetical protein
MDKAEIGRTIERVASKEFKVLEEFRWANQLQTSNQEAVKLLGSKSVNSLRLTEISIKLDQAHKGNKAAPMFYTPCQVTVPMTIPVYMQMQDVEKYRKYCELIAGVDACGMWRVSDDRSKILDLLAQVYQETEKDSLAELIWEIQAAFLKMHLSKTSLVAVRSSSTLEDLKKMAGAGLFDSILNIPLSDMSRLR